MAEPECYTNVMMMTVCLGTILNIEETEKHYLVKVHFTKVLIFSTIRYFQYSNLPLQYM